MSQAGSVKLHSEPALSRSSMLVGWSEDAGNLGEEVTEYLNRALRGHEFGEVDPQSFFPLSGVAVRKDVARVPESKFFVCPSHAIVIFRSDPPRSEWYGFLDSVLDVAEHHCHSEQLYILGAMVSFSAHTAPRQLFVVANSAEAKEGLSQYDLVTDMDYQTPPGQRPTLNSYLLWIAKGRRISGVSLWIPIPFYLVAAEDPQAKKKALLFFNDRLNLKMDLSDLDREIQDQNEKLARARSRSTEIDDYIRRLEGNLMLTDEENRELIRKIEQALSEEG